MSTNASANLSRNLKHLRDTHGLTQQQLSARSEVPRPTLAHLESGSANPTLSVLTRVASALNVSIEELIAPPRANARFYGVDELPVRERGRVRVRRLLPEPLAGIELERMSFARDARLTGVPHTPGTREYLYCERGRIQLSAAGSTWELGPGDAVVFRGDQRHGYRNLGDGTSVAYSVVLLAPSPS